MFLNIFGGLQDYGVFFREICWFLQLKNNDVQLVIDLLKFPEQPAEEQSPHGVHKLYSPEHDWQSHFLTSTRSDDMRRNNVNRSRRRCGWSRPCARSRRSQWPIVIYRSTLPQA